MYQGYKTSYKTEILSRDKKINLADATAPSARLPPPYPHVALLLKIFSTLASASFVSTFFRFLARETRFI